MHQYKRKKRIPLLFILAFFSIEAMGQKIMLYIDPLTTYQVIDNIGASSAWYTEYVGKYWDSTQRNNMAKWLFSRRFDTKGNPEGIGLSSFRFNIGGGTSEQGIHSGLNMEQRRVECFLNADGTYDWSKQSGYIWFVRQAKNYGVERLIAFSNTPPVHYTSDSLGYKKVLDYKSNLKPDAYGAFAGFLTNVLQHFSSEGLTFDYISPVNEPQWKWFNSDQEGSPWTNAEIYKVTKALDSALGKANVKTQILLPEAGNLEYLYSHPGPAGRQIQDFFGDKSPYKVKTFSHVKNVVCGHSYYTDSSSKHRKAIRLQLHDTARFYGTQYWQSEYSMLGDGYTEGKKGPISSMNCALFLSKVMHDDFVYGNAAAWQFWNSCEPGSAEFDTRYYLLALREADSSFKKGVVIPTKMLWAMGNYSRFVLPGMKRVKSQIDPLPQVIGGDSTVLVSVFSNTKQCVIVCVNDGAAKKIFPYICSHFRIKNKVAKYVTDINNNLAYNTQKLSSAGIDLVAQAVVTLVLDYVEK